MSQGVRPNRKLCVVFVDHIARVSGGEIALLRVLPALALDVDVHVILGEDGPLVERLREIGIEPEVMPLDSSVRDLRKASIRSGWFGPLPLAHLALYVLRLSRRLRQLDADLVHTNSLKAHLYGGLAARIARIPVLWHVRDRIATDYLPPLAVTLVRCLSRTLPTAVVANSYATLGTLPKPLRDWALRSSVVPDSIDTPPILPTRSASEVRVGVVGRLAPWKGQHVFLEAFAEAFGGTNVEGRVIGSALFGEHAYAVSLQEQADRLGIADQIEFRGFRRNVWAELNEIDILVHCSVTPEPFGQVILEGMAAGVPVIAAAAGGPLEIITDGVDGVLTTPGDAGDLASALRRLYYDPDLRAHLACAALRRSRDFSPARTAKQLIGIYSEIVMRR